MKLTVHKSEGMLDCLMCVVQSLAVVDVLQAILNHENINFTQGFGDNSCTVFFFALEDEITIQITIADWLASLIILQRTEV